MIHRPTVLLAAGVALLLPVSALAQAAPPPASESAGSDVVVLSPFEVSSAQEGYSASNSITASRFALPILDTPMSITVVTEEFLKDIGARDALESLSYVSGVTEGSAAIRLEGSNSFNVRGATTPFILRDGVKFYGLNDGYNIERWEVLKGIVGMMYGEKNLGGVVNAVTKRPRVRPGGEIFVRTDEYGSVRGSLDVTGPLNASKTLLYRVNLLSKNEKTFMQDEVLLADGATATVAWQPFENTRLSATYEIYRQGNTLASKLPPAQNANGPRFPGDTKWQVREGYAPMPLDFNYGGPGSFLDEDNDLLTVTLDQKILPWLSFRSYLNYATREQERLNRDSFGWFFKEVVQYNGGATTPASFTYFDFNANNGAGGLVTRAWNDPVFVAAAPFIASNAQSNLRRNDNQDFLWRNDLLAEYRFLGVKHRTLLGYEMQERSGDSRTYNWFSLFSLDPARNPYAAALRAAQQQGAGNPGVVAIDIRQIPAVNLPSPTIEEIEREFATNPAFRGGGGGRTENILAFYGVHYAQFWQDRITAMVGLRQDRFRITPTWGYPNNNPGNPRSFNYAEPNWRVYNSPQAGVSFRVRPDVSVYAAWAEVLIDLNSGGGGTPWENELVQTNGVWSRGPNQNQEPQMGENLEFGIKTELFEGRLSSTLALFHTVKQNVPYTVPRGDSNNITGSAFEYRTLAGEETYKGLELDLVYNIRPNWSALVSYAYTDATVSKDSSLFTVPDTDPAPGNQNPQVFKNVEGVQVSNQPKNQLRIWNNYRFLNESGLLKGMGIGVGVRYSDESNILAQYNTRGINVARTIVDLSFARKFRVFDRDLNLVLRCNNALDKRYYSTRQIYGDPRNFVLEARYRF